MKKFRTLITSLLMITLLMGGLATYAQEHAVEIQVGGTGARAAMGYFLAAMFHSDLTFLRDGGALSGRVELNELQFNVENGNERTLQRADIGNMIFQDGLDQLSLTNGEQLKGELQIDTLTIISPTGEPIQVAKSDVYMTMFNQTINEVSEGDGNGPRVFMRVTTGLQIQNLSAQYAKALTAYDLLVYPNQQLWSGTVLNEQVTFHSNSFGTLTINVEDLDNVQLGANAEEGQDFITMEVGDRLSGVLDENSMLQFQRAGVTDDQGNPITTTLQRGEIQLVTFKQPASAFGGGGLGPGLGSGPGH